MANDDLAGLFANGGDGKPVVMRQGIIVSWDGSTGENVVNVGGAEITNMAFTIAESAVLETGDVVQLMSSGGKWYITGKVTDPGESSVVPQWTGDIANLNDVVVPELTTNIATAQSTADTAQSTATTAASDAASALDAANAAASDASDALAAVTSDGNPPASSPAAEVIGGLEILHVRFTPIVNNDPVTYEIHISDTDDFTPDGDNTLAGKTLTSPFTIKALPGEEPASADDPDPRKIQYDTDYYVKIVATDEDGAADPGTQGTARIFPITGENIAADSITAAQIAAGTITGDQLAASVIVAGDIKTGETGQRVQLGAGGLKGYKSDDTLMVSFPTEEGEEALFDGELISRGLTVLGGASFQSTNNEVTADASFTLMRGISSPSATPQVGVTYDTVPISTTSLSLVQKTGPLGTFDLIPSEVYCMEWKDASTDYWVLYQIRSGGSRAWFFRVSDGAPITIGGDYFTDYVDWAMYSVWEITSGSNAGVYRMARWLPSGSALTYYMWSPAGLNRYSRQNGEASPAIGSDGTNIFTAEVISGSLRIRYWNPNGDGNNLSGPLATYESGQGYTTAASLCTILYGQFDVGANRYATAQRGVNYNARLLNVSGSNLYPAGSGNNWSGTNKEAYSFESPVTNRRGMAWDGGNSCFWTFGADGLMYKHTGEQWDPAVSSQTYWAKLTFYDSDSTGGTHETMPGPAKSYFAKRRAKNYFTAPEIPDNGGTNDPDQVRLYMARGSTAPANSSYHLQYTGSSSTTWTTMQTATANPPTSNNFPAATPATIENDDATLVISGDGTIKGTLVDQPQPVQVTDATLQSYSDPLLGTTYVSGSPVVGTTFVAPPTGKVYVTVSGRIQCQTASNTVYLSFEVRTGSTIGSGTVITAAEARRSVGVGGNATGFTFSRVVGSYRYLLTGLTPGDTYNARTMHAAQGPASAAANFYSRDLLIEPVL
jgi:hypothetical protein